MHQSIIFLMLGELCGNHMCHLLHLFPFTSHISCFWYKSLENHCPYFWLCEDALLNRLQVPGWVVLWDSVTTTELEEVKSHCW